MFTVSSVQKLTRPTLCTTISKWAMNFYFRVYHTAIPADILSNSRTIYNCSANYQNFCISADVATSRAASEAADHSYKWTYSNSCAAAQTSAQNMGSKTHDTCSVLYRYQYSGRPKKHWQTHSLVAPISRSV